MSKDSTTPVLYQGRRKNMTPDEDIWRDITRAEYEKIVAGKIPQWEARALAVVAPSVEDAQVLDDLRRLLGLTVAVAISMHYDHHKDDILNRFSLDELQAVAQMTQPLIDVDAQVEDIYYRAFRASQGTTGTP
jgi:hypothetical protein